MMLDKLIAGGAALIGGVAVAVASLGAAARLSLAAHWWASHITAAASWGVAQ